MTAPLPQTPDYRRASYLLQRSCIMIFWPRGQTQILRYPQSLDVRDSILILTEADVLPRPTMLRALTDAYFQHVHPFYPIVDESDLVGSRESILIQQAVCLAGSMTQHNSEIALFRRSQYEKVKTLIYLNYEADDVAILKATCLLTCHSMIFTDKVTLDGPWHWLGTAIRLAFQMGLHRNSTYRQHTYPGCMRRIFWLLVNSDRLATACWGRPSAFLHLPDFDIPPLIEQDFLPARGRRPMVFLQALKLFEILDTITKVNQDQSRITTETAEKSVDDLCTWIQNLPEELRLFAPDYQNARRAFWRPLTELHIWYFATIILLQLLDSARFPWNISYPSFAAASCIARLYEEIECREETPRLLQIHGFFCMVAAVPLICYPHDGLEDVMKAVREEEIDIICRVLSQMRHRYGGSDLVLRKIRRLRAEMRADNLNHSGCSIDRQSSSNDTDSPGWSMPATSSIQSRIDKLFPFPHELSGALALLRRNAGYTHYTDYTWTGGSQSGLGDGEMDYFSSGAHINLTDLLLMDFPLDGFGGSSSDGLTMDL
ncbi:fungal specific transcription factor domain-containing protein [Aspergillus stella-maris]|uniref:fungal specific transcription factor domain-containing protein n=1 Tax=Aspergillus stella-maris TaxID=1810926 RepID=UPI003CCD0F9A